MSRAVACLSNDLRDLTNLDENTGSSSVAATLISGACVFIVRKDISVAVIHDA
ncbi:unannotated protein [freshwater metagenome]|uniref:Unannotated protein n=1 Tax=freshwater metagenome TaxID=449393 RepID=A0A6J5ZN69_9ZZZZ